MNQRIKTAGFCMFRRVHGGACGGEKMRMIPVSYTHLDVYKRQEMACGAYLSAWKEKKVRIPVNDQEYEMLLKEKKEEEERWLTK